MLGKRGPTVGGFLHAPSHTQALTAVILRDRYITEGLTTATTPGARNIWSMQLSSDRIRLAQELLEEVRLGAHLYEVLGRWVERIAAQTPGRDPVADARTLRQTFPLHPGIPQWAIPPGTPCNGLNALNALLDLAPLLLPLDDAKRADLRALREALDAYGDLLVSEAVHQVVTGRADAAGGALDAAAGLAAPPTLDFATTPWDAEALASSVISLTPFIPLGRCRGRTRIDRRRFRRGRDRSSHGRWRRLALDRRRPAGQPDVARPRSRRRAVRAQRAARQAGAPSAGTGRRCAAAGQ